MQSPTKKRRVWELDFIRGLCLLLMVMDHMFFDFASLGEWFSNFYQINNAAVTRLMQFARYYWSHPIRENVRLCVIGLFLLLSGVSCALSRNNLVRGIELAVVSAGFTIVTYLADSLFGLDVLIVFGVLHCLTVSVLLFVLTSVNRPNKLYYLLFGAVILAITAIMRIDILDLPYAEMNGLGDFLKVALGTHYFGADFFGLFPFTGLFFIGAYVGLTFYKNKRSLLPKLDRSWHLPVTFVGRNALLVYLAHQPVIMAIIFAVMWSLGYRM